MSNKKKEFFLVRWFKRCFLHERPELSTEEEEKIQTPMRAMVSNFTHRPLAMFGLIVFLAIFVFVMVGPHIWVLDLSEQDSTLTNLPPSSNMMQVPKALLDNGVKDISSGNTYGVGIDNKGELYTWGHTRITDKIDVANIPDEIKSADLVQIAAGTDHVVAVDTDGEVYVWGNTRLQQDKFSNDMPAARIGTWCSSKRATSSPPSSARTAISTSGATATWPISRSAASIRARSPRSR